jgi:hypothetical protein
MGDGWMKNRYDIRGDEVVIYLDRRDGSVLETRISLSDFEHVNAFPGKWYAHLNKKRKWYVWANGKDSDGKPITIHLHRYIMNPPEGLQVDHFDGDSLNNTRQNLRIVTQSQNQQNRQSARRDSKTGIRGVSFSNGRWIAYAQVNGKRKHLGSFNTAKEAEDCVVKFRERFMPFSQEAARRRSS